LTQGLVTASTNTFGTTLRSPKSLAPGGHLIRNVNCSTLINPNSKLSDGMTPFMLATQRGYDNVVHLVLEDENLTVEEIVASTV
jgi:hypothetical protein